MDAMSDQEWIGRLGDGDRDRFERISAALRSQGYDEQAARERTRLDMEQRHAPLAFDGLLGSVGPRDRSGDAGSRIKELLEGQGTVALEKEHGPSVQAAREAIGRIIAAGGSHEDLEAFAYLVEALKVDDVGFALSQGGFDSDLPGWRLMETWDGDPTGRPLSHWAIFAADYAAEHRSATEPDAACIAPSPECAMQAVGIERELRVTLNEGISDTPLVGPEFWRALALARDEGELWGKIPDRCKYVEARVRAAELGDMVMRMVTTLDYALEHEDNDVLFAKHLTQDVVDGRIMAARDFERVLAIPLREVVAALSALAPGRKGPFTGMHGHDLDD